VAAAARELEAQQRRGRRDTMVHELEARQRRLSTRAQ
jgi:hypothetical protein